MLEAAIRAKAEVIYTEDFSHGQRFGALTVVNPFLQPHTSATVSAA